MTSTSFTLKGDGLLIRHVGRRDLLASVGACPICDQMATLRSFTTTRYLAPIGVRLLPLERCRIVDHCSACGRYQSYPLRTFQERQRQDYADANYLLAAPRLDELTALDALRLLTAYREPAVIHRALERIELALPDSPEALLFIAETHRLLGDFTQAERATARSLALRENTDVRESLAEFQFKRGDIDAGRLTLEPILSGSSPRASQAVRAGAEAMQRLGRHAEVLALLSRAPVADVAPDVAEALAQIRLAAERAFRRTSPEAMPPVEFRDQPKVEVEGAPQRVHAVRIPWSRRRTART